MARPEEHLSKREHIVLEVVDTERSFVTYIRTAIAVFVTPWIDSGRTLEDIGDIALAALLKELELIESFARTLLQDLEDEVAAACRMGKVFKDFGPFLKMFANYLTLYDQWKSKGGLNEDASDFAQFVKQSELDTRCNGLSLDSFLITPVQRVPRYRMLLEELLKETHSSHPDYDDLHAALALVSQAAETNNARMARTEASSYEALTQLQLKLFDPRGELNLLDWPARKLELGPTEMKKLCRKGPKVFTFWLVSDKILYAQRLSTTGLTAQFQLNRQIGLDDCLVRDTAFRTLSQRTTQRAAKLLAETAEILPRNRSQCFQILSSKKSFVVEAPSVKLANEWRNAIARLQPAARKRSTLQSSSAKASVAPIWTPDRAVKACQKCAEPFTVLRRRHHCRACGKCFCADCSKYSKVIPRLDANKKQRVCFSCFNRPDIFPGEEDLQGFMMPSHNSTGAWHVPPTNPFNTAAADPERDQDNDDTDDDDEDDDDYSPPKRPPPIAPHSTPERPSCQERPFNPFLKPPARRRNQPPPPPPPKTAPAVTRQSLSEQSPCSNVSDDTRCKTAPPELPVRSKPGLGDVTASRPYPQPIFDTTQRPDVEPAAHILNQPRQSGISQPDSLAKKNVSAWSCELRDEPKQLPPKCLQQWPRFAASTFAAQAPIAASPDETEAAPQRPPPQPPHQSSQMTTALSAEEQGEAPTPVWVTVSREASAKTLAERWAIVVASRSEPGAGLHKAKPARRKDLSADHASQKSTVKQRRPPFADEETKAEPQHMLPPSCQTNHAVLVQASKPAVSKQPWLNRDAPEPHGTPHPEPSLAGLRRAPRWPPPPPQPKSTRLKASSSLEHANSTAVCDGEDVRVEEMQALPGQAQSGSSVRVERPSPLVSRNQQFVPAASTEFRDSAQQQRCQPAQRRAPRWPPQRSTDNDAQTALDSPESRGALPSYIVEAEAQHVLRQRTIAIKAPSAHADQQPRQMSPSTDQENSSLALCSQPKPRRTPPWPPRKTYFAKPTALSTPEGERSAPSASSKMSRTAAERLAQQPPRKELPGSAEAPTTTPTIAQQRLTASTESHDTPELQPNRPEAQDAPTRLQVRAGNTGPTAPDRSEREEGATSIGSAQEKAPTCDEATAFRPPPPPPRRRPPLPQQGLSAETSGTEKASRACQSSETSVDLPVDQHTAQPSVSQVSIVRDRVQLFSAAQLHQQPSAKMLNRNSDTDRHPPLNRAPPKRWTSVLPTAAESAAVIAARRAASARQASDVDREDEE